MPVKDAIETVGATDINDMNTAAATGIIAMVSAVSVTTVTVVVVLVADGEGGNAHFILHFLPQTTQGSMTNRRRKGSCETRRWRC